MNNIPKILEPTSVPLNGINLIEASAGTGKTYTISTLFIRLLLEKNLTVEKILVVTFTEAATEELRDRIRKRLRDTLLAFQTNNTDDKILAELLDKYQNKDEIITSLINAIRSFDEASIFTIHSFCKQMLQDNAFASGMLFDVELITDQNYLLHEIVEDFWRQNFYQTSQLFLNYALENGYKNPSSLLTNLNYGHLNIIPQFEVVDLKEDQFNKAFLAAKQVWNRQNIQDFLMASKSLNRNKYRNIPLWCKELDYFFAATPSVNLPEKFIKLTSSELAVSVKKGQIAPEHEFFDLAEQLLTCQADLVQAFKRHLLALKIELFAITKQTLIQKKQQHHIQSFDDLLTNLHKALTGSNGGNLANAIRNKYHVALIDEFQDTDSIQYEIFHTIYNKNSILFLIGDPKQAIYSFRGADIHTYLAASKDADKHYTLTTNWRSEADLINSTNLLFSQHNNPFLFEDIQFQPVSPPPNKQLTYTACLHLWYVTRSLAESKKSISKKWAKQHIPKAVGYEIARLLQSGMMIEKKPLVAGDIAILVRTNRQALQMQKTLTKQRIASVLYSRESLFDSHEVMEIKRILLAIAEPSREGLIKAALTTDIFGVSGNELYALMTDDKQWQMRLNRFQHYHFLWQRFGFIKMYRTMLLQEQVQTHLLSYPDGERRLTNILHVGEMLQQAAVQQKLGMNRLCEWLEQSHEEEELRLESDEKLVKIITIHKSKGLEYPIVFCPFIWDGILHNRKAEQFVFHNGTELTLDLGSEQQEQHRKQALTEEQAENLRLFYVAATRAKYRSYLVWGPFKDSADSALSHLLYPNIEQEDDGQFVQILQDLAAKSEQTLQISELPLKPVEYKRQIDTVEPLQALKFTGNIDKKWQVSSFTALSTHSYQAEQKYISYSEHDIFSFPRGAKAGLFFHFLLEHLDFSKPDSGLIQTQLANYGYDLEKWFPVVEQLVTDVINTSLGSFNLSQITCDKRMNELEFHYPLSHITDAGLQAIFANHSISHINSVRGFMKGYIDMIFEHEGRYYLVDYKSNMLGYKQDDYHYKQLHGAMKKEDYILQYYIYVVALHRYLAFRLPDYNYEEQFGGVYYLFLRGMKSEWGSEHGIYRDRPNIELIQELSDYFDGVSQNQ
ncbi:exodeoxyribonuclease V subunit beta [Candidatus Halobeggiatoa sp. HSG11]|nr:exodeoxyribonuclease V subunit beta [Candidatus Halobeggiatoa sp. HSG11]